MTTDCDADRGAIAFAERLLTLLDEGAFTATYKYAVLLALMDLCFEHSTRDGKRMAGAPTSVTTRQLAEKVIELYWPHAVPFANDDASASKAAARRARILRQNQPTRRGAGGQAEIVSAIVRFRERHATDSSAPLSRARARALPAFEKLVRDVEWKLVEMPLPRLQQVGKSDEAFIYRINWDRAVKRRDLDDHRRFDNQIRFIGAAGDHLVRLAGLLRPLIQREWAAMVARFNDLPDSRLEDFLFGADRVSLAPVRGPLTDLQSGRCFYCDARLRNDVAVDHFVPWSRYPNNALENLVVADEKCNGNKSDHLAAAEHVARWHQRNRQCASDLSSIAQQTLWEQGPDRSLNVARALYLRLPPGVRLWRGQREFEVLEPAALARALETRGAPCG